VAANETIFKAVEIQKDHIQNPNILTFQKHTKQYSHVFVLNIRSGLPFGTKEVKDKARIPLVDNSFSDSLAQLLQPSRLVKLEMRDSGNKK
jgi:hypothetical protein